MPGAHARPAREIRSFPLVSERPISDSIRLPQRAAFEEVLNDRFDNVKRARLDRVKRIHLQVTG